MARKTWGNISWEASNKCFLHLYSRHGEENVRSFLLSMALWKKIKPSFCSHFMIKKQQPEVETHGRNLVMAWVGPWISRPWILSCVHLAMWDCSFAHSWSAWHLGLCNICCWRLSNWYRFLGEESGVMRGESRKILITKSLTSVFLRNGSTWQYIVA